MACPSVETIISGVRHTRHTPFFHGRARALKPCHHAAPCMHSLTLCTRNNIRPDAATLLMPLATQRHAQKTLCPTPFVGLRWRYLAARPIHRATQRIAHPHARRAAQPGHAPQTQTGAPPVRFHQALAARPGSRAATGLGWHHPGRPRRGQVVSGLYPVRPVFSRAQPRHDLRHRNPPGIGRSLSRIGAAAGLCAHAFSGTQLRSICPHG